ENEGVLVKESRPVDLSQIAVIDPLPDIPSIDRKRATEMFANLLSRGEAHLGRNQAYRRIIPRWHFEMLNDEKRNAAFEKVLNSAITPDTIVFDIGSG